MKALVWRGENRLMLEERPIVCPQDGQAVVRVEAAGVCATDLHVMAGLLPTARPPMVLGHEVAGTVTELGPGVAGDLLGARVLVDPVIGCGVCRACRAQRKLLCRAGGELGTSAGDGGYAEYLTLPAVNLMRLPAQVSFEAAALVEPLDCTLGAFGRAHAKPGESVLILGNGPAGMLFVQLARVAGCDPILLVGRGAARLALGRRLGAAVAWDYGDPDLDQRIAEATGGEGPDIVVEASGAAVARAFALVAPGGRVVLYGIGAGDDPNIASNKIIAKDLSVVTGIGDSRLWGEALAMVASGRVRMDDMVTHRFGLHEIDEALKTARDVEASVKVMLRPHGGQS